ncbi:MAG: sulfotransferase family protein [Egibacteraceae bacterium]
MSDRTTVLYIAGSGRSGSTLLASILGQVDGFFAIGEFSNIWQRGFAENWLCGCGVRFSQCVLWRQIVERAFGDEAIDDARMIAAQRGAIRVRHVPSALLGSRRLRALGAGEYGRRLARFYAAIREVTGCRVIVDSSKQPTVGRLLEEIGSLEVFVIHLIRDPRASAYSWRRRKAQPDRGHFGYMRQQSPLRSGALWAIWNATAAALWRADADRYHRLRYEDFAARPKEEVERILKFLGHEGEPTPFADERTVHLKTSHSVSGNPNRLDTGTVTISADAEWLARLERRDRALVTLVTLPLLRRFGYPLSPASQEHASRPPDPGG